MESAPGLAPAAECAGVSSLPRRARPQNRESRRGARSPLPPALRPAQAPFFRGPGAPFPLAGEEVPRGPRPPQGRHRGEKGGPAPCGRPWKREKPSSRRPAPGRGGEGCCRSLSPRRGCRPGASGRFRALPAAACGLEAGEAPGRNHLLSLRGFLRAARERGEAPLLVLEHAETPDDEVLEQARLLSNFEGENEPLLTLLLAGDRALDEKLATGPFRASTPAGGRALPPRAAHGRGYRGLHPPPAHGGGPLPGDLRPRGRSRDRAPGRGHPAADRPPLHPCARPGPRGRQALLHRRVGAEKRPAAGGGAA